jgi:general secretion pathway protein G
MSHRDQAMCKSVNSAMLSTKGYSLVELVIVLMIIFTLAGIAIPRYLEAVNAAKIVHAVGDIKAIATKVDLYFLANSVYPETLSDVLDQEEIDPWGQPYEYLNFQGVNGKGKMRKDKNLVPINSDYDLYSMGEDGESESPLTAQKSRDDIVRANNGGFIGLAENY